MKRVSAILVLVFVALVFSLGCPPKEPPPPPPPECTQDTDCAVGSVCEADVCEPAACPDIYDPVCGVDGRTYSNACEARAAHVEVGHQGECPQVCGGIQAIPCPEGQICDLPAGMCQGADLQGVCVERPEACAEVFEPVCGCDGVTYSNDCFRQMAGMQKDHDGECQG